MTVLLLLAIGCAGRTARVPGPLRAVDGAPPADVGAAPPRPRDRRPRDDLGARLADAAEHFLQHDTRGFRSDCSGFVEAVFDRVGVPLRGSTADLWAASEARDATRLHGPIEPGDVIFFDHTYDRNGNRKVDDALSHVAIAIDVMPSGVVWMAHDGTSLGRTTLAMDLARPDVHVAEDGELVNGILRRERRSDPKGTPHLASECFHGLARFRWEHFAQGAAEGPPFADAGGHD